jgi:hypothetical protein
MKKIILVAALFVSVGAFTSCSKENNVKPSVSKTLADGPGDRHTLGSGDGTRPSEGG